MTRVIELLGDSYTFINGERTLPSEPQKAEFIPFDITDREHVTDVLKKRQPDVIMHAAAMTNLELCETEKDKAHLINVTGTETIAAAATEIGAYLIYISTDFVFKGDRGNYIEADIPDPVNYYGQTKYEGELAVQKLTENACIARITFPYRARFPQKMDCIRWMWEKMGRGDSITAVTDQKATPTFIDDIAHALDFIIRKQPKGIYHVAGRSRHSWFEIAQTVAKVFEYDPQLVSPITYEQFTAGKVRAPRPTDSSLNIDKIKRELGIEMSDIRTGLLAIKEQLKESI